MPTVIYIDAEQLMKLLLRRKDLSSHEVRVECSSGKVKLEPKRTKKEK